MKKYLASILIANYNNAKFLDRSIQSCLNQSYKNLEILIHDDRSSDKSLSVLKKYKNKSIKFFQNKSKKSGISAIDAKNSYYKLIKIAKGHIIFLLDSDDYFKKNKVYEVIKIFKKKDKIDFIQNLPLLKSANGIKKKKNKNNILSFWPYLAPESCISFRRKFIDKFIKKNLVIEKKYNNVWLGFRLGIFAYFITKSFYSLNKNLTVYESHGESKKYNFLGYNWFIRRFNSYRYLNKISKNKIIFNYRIDYLVTKFIYSILKVIK
jgi:glycosyltransferase involved in cell wall biosynthesis